METLTASQVRATDGLQDWRVLLGLLRARFYTPDMSAGAEFVNRIVEAANSANHHPDLHLSYSYVDVDLTSHDAGGLTARDVDMAKEISRLAAAAGLTADPD